MTRRNPFPGVSRAVDRHATVRWRFRRRGLSCYLPGPYASTEFRAAYEAAVEGAKAPSRSRTSRGTLSWLVEKYLANRRYADLSPGRRRNLRRSWTGCATRRAICLSLALRSSTSKP